MVSTYFIDKDPLCNGMHVIHSASCKSLCGSNAPQELGEHDDWKEALKEAEKTHEQVVGCFWCCPEAIRR
jgi:hypothetical protein